MDRGLAQAGCMSNSLARHSPGKMRIIYSRTRNGCERCRARRRKCDEGHPHCQRCVKASVPCQYNTRMRFHESCRLDASGPTDASSAAKIAVEDPFSPAEVINSVQAGKDKIPHAAELSSWSINSQLPTEAVELLHHYIRYIAPWLDNVDSDQAFAELIPRLAMTAAPVILRKLLELSANSQGRQAAIASRLTNSLLTPNDYSRMLSGTSAQAVTVSTAFVLVKAGEFMINEPSQWAPTYSSGDVPTWVFQFSNSDMPRITLAIASVMSRLELAQALFHQRAPTLGSSVLQEAIDAYLPFFSSAALLGPALESLINLTDITIACVNAVDEPTEGQSTRWDASLRTLQSWYSRRTQSLTPVAEDDEMQDEDRLPTIVFTNSTAVWCNIVYHTSMILLINARTASYHSSAMAEPQQADNRQLSVEWHARRVCGIAILCLPECWDPLMIVAFYIAARKESIANYALREQLTQCLKKVKAASGWRIDSMISDLTEHNN